MQSRFYRTVCVWLCVYLSTGLHGSVIASDYIIDNEVGGKFSVNASLDKELSDGSYNISIRINDSDGVSNDNVYLYYKEVKGSDYEKIKLTRLTIYDYHAEKLNIRDVEEIAYYIQTKDTEGGSVLYGSNNYPITLKANNKYDSLQETPMVIASGKNYQSNIYEAEESSKSGAWVWIALGVIVVAAIIALASGGGGGDPPPEPPPEPSP